MTLKDEKNRTRLEKARSELRRLHAERLLKEKEWAGKGERIIEPTTINFPDIDGYTLLDYAILLDDAEDIETLLEQGATSQNALALVMMNGKKGFFDSFRNHGWKLDYGSLDLPVTDEKALRLLNSYAKEEFANLRAAAKAGICYNRNQLLKVAAFMAWEDLEKEIEFLVPDFKPDINQYDTTGEDNKGFTPLHWAVKQGNLKLIELYIHQLSCSVNQSTKNFLSQTSPTETALHLAVKAGNLDIVKLLIENGANVKEIHPEGNLLALALKSGNPELVKYFLSLKNVEYFSNFEESDGCQRSVLHHLSYSGDPYYIALAYQILNQKRKDPNFDITKLKDIFGNDPIQTARDSSNIKFLNMVAEIYPEVEIGNYHKKSYTNISQGIVIPKLAYFLRLMNHNPKSMPGGGIAMA